MQTCLKQGSEAVYMQTCTCLKQGSEAVYYYCTLHVQIPLIPSSKLMLKIILKEN